MPLRATFLCFATIWSSTAAWAVPTTDPPPLAECIITTTDPGPNSFAESRLEEDPVCEATGTPVAGVFGLPIDAFPEVPTATGTAGYKYVGVYSDANYGPNPGRPDGGIRTNGVSVRIKVTDPTVPHPGPACTYQGRPTWDMVAHRIMVKWVYNPAGATTLLKYAWLEVGWRERANGADDQYIYASINQPWLADTNPAAETYSSFDYGQFSLDPGDSLPFLIKRAWDHPWRAQVFYEGRWRYLKYAGFSNLPESLPMFETFSETSTLCGGQEIRVGSTSGYIGSTNDDYQPLRVKDSQMVWHKYTQASYPSTNAGGPSRTNSTRLCIGSSYACESAVWNGNWYAFNLYGEVIPA